MVKNTAKSDKKHAFVYVLAGKDGTKIKLQLKKDDKQREVSFKLKSLI